MNWPLVGLFSFVAGVLTFLAPCSLPLLPAYLTNIMSGGDKKLIVRTILFAIGFIALFLVLGFSAGGIGQFVLVHKRTIIFYSSLIFIIAGVFTIFGISLIKNDSSYRFGSSSTMLFGALFGATWSGCIGPILGLMLVLAANTQTAIGGGIVLVLYALGLLFPLFILSFFLDRLPPNHPIWNILRGKLFSFTLFNRKYYMHSTNIVAGFMFIFLGIIMLINLKYNLTVLSPSWTSEWTFDLQETLRNVLARE